MIMGRLTYVRLQTIVVLPIYFTISVCCPTIYRFSYLYDTNMSHCDYFEYSYYDSVSSISIFSYIIYYDKYFKSLIVYDELSLQ